MDVKCQHIFTCQLEKNLIKIFSIAMLKSLIVTIKFFCMWNTWIIGSSKVN